jgi:Tfp pilus assembly protein PilN
VRQQDENFQQQEDRRQAERDSKAASNSTSRGAFVLAQKVFDQSQKKEAELYETFLQKENSLSRQLKLSEDGETFSYIRCPCHINIELFAATNKRIQETTERLRQEFIKEKKAAELLKDTTSDDKAKVGA